MDQPFAFVVCVQVEAWLPVLFRDIVLPPRRPVGQICTEHKPLTLRLLFDVLLHLCHLGYPPHSVSLLLCSLLSYPFSPSSINLFSLCQSELRALSNIYAPLLPFPLSPLLVTQSPGPTRRYSISIKATLVPDMMQGNAGTVPVLGAMLIRRIRPDRRHGDEDESDDEDMWGDRDVMPYLERGVGVRLLSVIDWDSEILKLTFIMGQDEFKNLVREGGWGVRLWRNDGYEFESGRTLLKYAQRE
jgi:hypothetical protein